MADRTLREDAKALMGASALVDCTVCAEQMRARATQLYAEADRAPACPEPTREDH